MQLLSPAALSFVLSVSFVRLLASPWLAQPVLDVPNERSLHAGPIPRSGGIGLLAAVGLSWLVFADRALWQVLALTACLAVASLVDDVKRLPIGARLLIQAGAAAALLWTADVPAIAFPAFLVGILWMINLYNFMDGADGLAGGMTVFGFAGYAAAGAMTGQQDIAMISAIVSTAALGFLVWNFHPARIFLGDCGSVPLGFLAAAVGLIGWVRGAWPYWFPVVLFSPFIVDATLTLLRRAARGDNLLVAHREHYYQRLIRSGFGHRKTAIAAYGLMFCCVLLALASRDMDSRVAIAIVLALAGVFLIGAIVIERYLARLQVPAMEK